MQTLRILFKNSIPRWVTIGNADAQNVHAVLFIAVQKSFYMFKVNLNMTVRGSSTNSQHLQFWFCILLNIFGKRIAFPLLQHENELTLTLAQQSRSLCVTSLMLGRRWCYHILISRDIHPLCRQTQVCPSGSVGQCQNHLWRGQHKVPQSTGPPLGAFWWKDTSFLLQEGGRAQILLCRSSQFPLGEAFLCVCSTQGRSQLSRSWASRCASNTPARKQLEAGKELGHCWRGISHTRNLFWPANPSSKRGLLSWLCESQGWSGLVLVKEALWGEMFNLLTLGRKRLIKVL